MSTRKFMHDTDDRRFTLFINDKEVGFTEYTLRGDIRDFSHTVIKPEFRGRGLSQMLIAFALNDSREEGIKIHPTCSAVAKFVKDNPEYQNLVSD